MCCRCLALRDTGKTLPLGLAEESDTRQIIIQTHEYNYEGEGPDTSLRVEELVREGFPEEAAFELRAEELGEAM